MTTTKTKNRAGFTMVELFAVLVPAAVIAVTAGTMLYFIYMSWARLNIAVELQRDATYAVDFIARRLQPAAEVSVSAEKISWPTNHCPIGAGEFEKQGAVLWFDNYSDQILVATNLIEFSPIDLGDGIVQYIIGLRDNGNTDTIYISNRVYLRNYQP